MLRSATAALTLTQVPIKALRMMNLHKSLDVDLEETKSLAVAVEPLHRLEDSISKVSAIPALANTATITKSALVLALHRSKIP